MTKHSPTTSAVTTSVSQPPSPNFSNTVMARIVAHRTKPTTNTAAFRIHPGITRRSAKVLRAMANSDSEKVRNTLMLYMTTIFPTSPRV